MTSASGAGHGSNSSRPDDWAATLSLHERWLRTVVWARIRDNAGVDEVMQEVSLATVRQSAPLHDPVKVAPWLYRLAVRYALLYRRDHGRSRRRINEYATRERPEEHNCRELEPPHWLLSRERQQLVRAALAELPPRDAEILLLKYSENWSYRQIAEHVGISHSAVETRLHRARQRLRDALLRTDVIDETPSDESSSRPRSASLRIVR